MPELQDILLYGGIGLIALGAIAGIVVLIVVLARRAAGRGKRGGSPPELASTSPFAAFELAGGETAGPDAVAADSESDPAAASGSSSSSISTAFVAGPPQEHLVGDPAMGSESSSWALSDSGAGSEPPVTMAPTEIVAADMPDEARESAAPGAPGAPVPTPSWQDIVATLGDPEPFQYTTGSYAVPAPNPLSGPAPAATSAPVERGDSPEVAPLPNPWATTGPQQPAVPAPAAPVIAPAPQMPETPETPVSQPPVFEPAPEPRAAGAEPDPEIRAAPAEPDPEPRAAATVVPAPEPRAAAAPTTNPPVSPVDDDDRTVLVPGRATAIAPWLLIVDTGERVPLHDEAAVLGRRPAPVEHGVAGIAIPDPSKTISKVHARIDRVGEHWTVTDLDSTNGTTIVEAGGRERPLPPGGSGALRGRFLLGEVGLVIVRNPEATA